MKFQKPLQLMSGLLLVSSFSWAQTSTQATPGGPVSGTSSAAGVGTATSTKTGGAIIQDATRNQVGDQYTTPQGNWNYPSGTGTAGGAIGTGGAPVDTATGDSTFGNDNTSGAILMDESTRPLSGSSSGTIEEEQNLSGTSTGVQNMRRQAPPIHQGTTDIHQPAPGPGINDGNRPQTTTPNTTQ